MKDFLPSLSLKHIRSDFSSGLVVFLVAIPLCLGIALASEAPLMSGIIAGLVGGIVVGLFGGSELGVSGPAAGLVAIVIAAKDELGAFEVLLLATLIAGLIQLLFGIARAGVVAYYIPTSVIKGMLAAIGIIIIMKQIPHAVGYDADYEGDLTFAQPDGHNTFTEFSYLLDAIQPGAAIICGVGLAILMLWNLPFFKKIPLFKVLSGPLVAVASGVALQASFLAFAPDLAVGSSGMVNLATDKSAVEWITMPDFTAIGNSQVWVYALIIAFVASVESLLCAEATDKMDPEKRITPMNKELRAQGIANVVSGMIGGLPITQVIVRSSANVQSGARTRTSAVFHGMLILISVLLLPNILNMIPLASLAAILLVVGFKLVRPSLFKLIYKKGWGQFVPFIVTIIAILLTDLLIGIGIGLAVAIVFILVGNFRAPYTYELEDENGHPLVRIRLSEIVSFLNKGNILATLRGIPDGSHVVIDGTRNHFIDYDVEEVIQDFIENAKHRNIEVEFVRNSGGGGNPNKPKDLQKILNVSDTPQQMMEAKKGMTGG